MTRRRRTGARPQRTAATRRAYASDWAAFESWCVLERVAPLPARTETIALYLRSLAGEAKLSTLRRKLAAIHATHRDRDRPLPARQPELRALFVELAGERRLHSAPRPAASPEDVMALVKALPHDVAGLRDRALILLGWVTASRPAEVLALDVTDVRATTRSVTLTMGLRREASAGRTVVLVGRSGDDACPTRWLRAWLRVLQADAGPLFRPVSRHGRIGAGRLSVQMMRLVLRRAALAAGIPLERVSADGLRISAPAAQSRVA